MKAKIEDDEVEIHFPHKHHWKLRWNHEGELWLECDCGRQMEVPEEDLEASYEQIKNHDSSK